MPRLISPGPAAYGRPCAPYARGVYVNYLGVGEASDRVRAAYGNEKYARLVELKNRYDPTNTFRYNQNIKPSV